MVPSLAPGPLTPELGLTYTTRQVPAKRDARTELRAATGDSEIPVLVAVGETVRGKHAILAI
jgi:hypothetical protein